MPDKRKKNKKKNTTDLSDIFLSYMLMNVIDKGKKTKKKSKYDNITIDIIDEEESMEEEED